MKSGLKVKIFKLCIMIVAIAAVGFATLSVIQISSLRKLTKEYGDRQMESAKEQSEDYLMYLTEQSMQTTVWAVGQVISYELWIIQHDCDSLASQVTNILEHPERYSEQEVFSPNKENGGDLALQLLTPRGYIPSGEDMKLIRKLATLEPMMKEMIQSSNDGTLEMMIALPNGMSIEMDALSAQKFNKDGELIDYDPRKRDWWIDAVESGEPIMGVPSYSELMNLVVMEYSIPIYIDDELKAVVEISIKHSRVQKTLQDLSYGKTGFSVIIDSDGYIISSPQTEGELAFDLEYKNNVREGENAELVQALDALGTERFGFLDTTIDGHDYYLAFENEDLGNLTLMMFISKDELDTPTNELLAGMDDITSETMEEYDNSFMRSMLSLLAAVAVLLAIALFAGFTFSNRLTEPIDQMTKNVKSITGDSFDFKMSDIYQTGDEIEVLAETFEELSTRTKNYINEITDITAEKERIGAELNVAKKIQADMLPNHFPLYPDRKEFDMYATMTPAKQVGGDFYDMSLIDDDPLCTVMGDVSGKGVPAALFMVISKTMLKNRALSGGKPSEILHDVNNSLCEGNDENMFVTIWLGILTISTGELIQASAGHEYPVIKKKDGDYELITTENGLVIGFMKNIEYKDLVFNLNSGDSLFMYTDGLPEATNAQDKRYEIEGMLGALNKHKDDEPSELLSDIQKEVDDFVKEAPQFDDLTMMILKYNGREV
jgi:sigma-B regulation protein RsbU (phosphoserine phosphatase)